MLRLQPPAPEQPTSPESATVALNITLRSAATVSSEKHPESNEDAFYTSERVFVVCDGVGSYHKSLGAQVASQTIGAVLNESSGSCHTQSDTENLMRTAFEKAHYSAQECASPTTATAAYFWNDGSTAKVTIGNVGDSEAFLIRDGDIALLSWKAGELLDAHERYQQIIKFLGLQATSRAGLAKMIEETDNLPANPFDGDAAEKAARYFQSRHFINSAVGHGANPPEPVINTYSLREGDVLVLVTDGIIDPLVPDEIQAIVAAGGSAYDLLEAAKASQWEDRQKMDDRTAIIVECHAK